MFTIFRLFSVYDLRVVYRRATFLVLLILQILLLLFIVITRLHLLMLYRVRYTRLLMRRYQIVILLVL